jgi:hypothetical protein
LVKSKKPEALRFWGVEKRTDFTSKSGIVYVKGKNMHQQVDSLVDAVRSKLT